MSVDILLEYLVNVYPFTTVSNNTTNKNKAFKKSGIIKFHRSIT